jgi:formylmethanofuran dehydrogenase subunit A
MKRFLGARVIDPTHSRHGELADLYVDAGRIVEPPAASQWAGESIDMGGAMVMAGAIDLHTHIGGGKVNLARLLMTDESQRASLAEHIEVAAARQRSAAPRVHGNFAPGPLWSSTVTGELYARMGYTTCFEPAMLLTQARGTHLQLADTPLLDTGAYVVMGNEDWLLRALASGCTAAEVRNLVAWTVQASQALAVKVVNAGGIHAFRFDQRTLDVDQPHARLGVTPRQILRELAAAVDELGLPHPLHVHTSNLGMPGNIAATLATIDAVEGRRLHLTHAQYHAYTAEGPFGMGSAAEQLARRVNETPELSLDVGQVVFGQTVTISADTAAQTRNSRHAKPSKAYIADVECSGGCGVVPIRYENKNYVNSLQWAIGLELLLLVKNPYQIFLTTDHPNGGPFTSYPHLIRLLMDRSFRAAALEAVHPAVAERSLLRELDREYSLDEIAILTRTAPARILGLHDRGHLRPGAVADLVFYEPRSDWEATFATARSVWKKGVEVMQDGRCVARAPTESLKCGGLEAGPLEPRWRSALENTLKVPVAALAISDEEMAAAVGKPPRAVTGGPG